MENHVLVINYDFSSLFNVTCMVLMILQSSSPHDITWDFILISFLSKFINMLCPIWCNDKVSSCHF